MSTNEVSCRTCGFSQQAENFYCIGACDGNGFCPKCCHEIELETGKPALLCGHCDSCKDLKEDEIFDDVQAERQKLAWSLEDDKDQQST